MADYREELNISNPKPCWTAITTKHLICVKKNPRQNKKQILLPLLILALSLLFTDFKSWKKRSARELMSIAIMFVLGFFHLWTKMLQIRLIYLTLCSVMPAVFLKGHKIFWGRKILFCYFYTYIILFCFLKAISVVIPLLSIFALLRQQSWILFAHKLCRIKQIRVCKLIYLLSNNQFNFVFLTLLNLLIYCLERVENL